MIHRLVLRRTLLSGSLLAVSAAVVWQYERLRPTHPLIVYLTGWILLALMLLLTAYNTRKKMPFIPLVSSRVWFQVHVYLGLFTGVMFLLHLNWHVPSGWFESILAWLFVGVTLSGIVGWWLSRMLPKRMTTVGGEVLYERIPVIRRGLRLRAEELALKAIPEAQATTLADFYTRDLSGYFGAPLGLWTSLFGSRRRLGAMLGDLNETKRYLTATEKTNAEQLADLIRQKEAVDFQGSAQFLLKSWLFVHIPLTYGLLIFTGVHVLLVYAFSGGAK